MQGRLIFINQLTREPEDQASGTGLIFGADRNRYRFELTEWQGGNLPPRNSMLEFEAAGDTALQVRLAGDGVSFAMADEFTAKPASDKAAKISPALKAPPAARLRLTEATPPPSRLKPILIGVMLSVLLVLIGIFVTHLHH